MSQLSFVCGKQDPLNVAEELLQRLPSLPPAERASRRNDIIELCAPWARREASRYRGGSEPADDLAQVAVVGLILAVDRYDPNRGVPFRHFALPTITGELKKHFRDRGWSIRVSRQTQELYQEVRRVEPWLAQQLGHVPTEAELATHLGLPLDQIRQARAAALAYRTGSLNRPRFEDDDRDEVGDYVGGPDPAFDLVINHDALCRAIRVLPERLRAVVSMRFVDELTQCQIADKIGVSQMHVSRLLARAMRLLREHMLAEAPDGDGADGGPATPSRVDRSVATSRNQQNRRLVASGR